MIEKLSWNVQKEGRFRMVTFLGSESGSCFPKRTQHLKTLNVWQAPTISQYSPSTPLVATSFIQNPYLEIGKWRAFALP